MFLSYPCTFLSFNCNKESAVNRVVYILVHMRSLIFARYASTGGDTEALPASGAMRSILTRCHDEH